ncbi:MAG: hypothetical protein JO368_07515 [Acidimicrobiales bacterium]|nr:hypothetical protein [Acidimicrobiales bacterium]
MSRVGPSAKKLAVGMAAAAALSLGAAGSAGASTPTPTPSSSSPSGSTGSTGSGGQAGSRLRSFDCSRAPKVLARIQRVEGDIHAGLPKLHAAAQKAAQAGKTRRALRLDRRITRLENPKTTARLDRVSKAIEAKCGAPAPASSGSTTATTGTGSGSTSAVASA